MDKNWIELINSKNQLQALTDTNTYTEKYGLLLSGEDAAQLTEAHSDSLKNRQRVEFNGGILPKIIFEFCDSAYLNQNNYLETLTALQDIFYLYKNEMLDEITDDELLHFMKEQFEDTCYGDLEYLSGTCLEIFAQAIRAGHHGFENSDGYGEFEQFDIAERFDYNMYLQALNDLLN